MKHTKGPWIVSGMNIKTENVDYMATNYQANILELNSNANLTAAAPQMLKLLLDLSNSGLEIGSWMDDIDKIIKKAKGQ